MQPNEGHRRFDRPRSGLVIIAVLVLLLNMNGLLRSSEVGDPLQVVVGIMLVVFGINVLVKFNKNDKLISVLLTKWYLMNIAPISTVGLGHSEIHRWL